MAVLAVVSASGLVRAQGFAADVFKLDRFDGVHAPGQSMDATVQITNPGSTGLEAWGTHLEEDGFLTETAFQTATLSDAELNLLAERCGGNVDNGSGYGLCSCGHTTDDPPEAMTPPGALCAMIYVFTSDQQLSQCCGCPVTPNGLLTLSVTHDLTDNPLTGVFPERGVIKLVSATPGPLDTCDPSAPQVPAAPPPPSSAPPTGQGAAQCQAQVGFARLDCALQGLGADPMCDLTAIRPRLQRRIVGKVNALRSRLQQAFHKGPKAFNRALAHARGGLTDLEQRLARAAKRRQITSACQAALQQQIGDLQAQVAGMRQ
jgi:hypothetical protein